MEEDVLVEMDQDKFEAFGQAVVDHALDQRLSRDEVYVLVTLLKRVLEVELDIVPGSAVMHDSLSHLN